MKQGDVIERGGNEFFVVLFDDSSIVAESKE